MSVEPSSTRADAPGDEPAVTLDPWCRDARNRTLVPLDARFLVAYEADEVGLAEYEEVLLFRRTADRDELWVVRGFDEISRLHGLGVPISAGTLREHVCEKAHGRVAAKPLEGTVDDATTELLQAYLTAVTRHAYIGRTITAGRIGRSALEQIVTGIHQRRTALAAAARERVERSGSPILDAARRLGLSVEPSGTGSNSWIGRCPGTGHFIMYNAEAGQFGCGYCGRSGGVDELKALVRERRGR